MLCADTLHREIQSGLHLLDGATGSNLMKAGMPKGCCAEEWIINHPEPLVALQRAYAAAGSQIIYAPTFQAQPLALARVGLDKQTESINASLASLSRSASPGCLIAGDIATMAALCDSWDSNCFDLLVENYRRQIRGLIDGGVDLLIAETLLYPQEAEAVLTAAALENAGSVICSFTMQSDGALFSGMDAGPVFAELEKAGAAALGFNCVAADPLTPSLVAKLRRYTKLPILCKPNAGNPVIGSDGLAHYPMTEQAFGHILQQCRQMGASLVGGCCGTDPNFIRTYKEIIANNEKM